ncbi:MAG: hypothetical protein K2P81_04650 [Bacteriovoracaceae bacterium]|nr:hypothetical protein [Bacteriovoracaceae bacterium]
MKTFLKLVLANLSVITMCYATTFQPLPVEKLIQPADAILLGDFLSSKSVELEDGTMATEAQFKIERESGLDAEEFGLTEVKVYYPGGRIGHRVTQVEGAPQFVSGEKNVIFLKQNEDGRLWVQGLAMGTFKVVRIGQTTLLINSVFPSNPELSRIEMSKFLRKVASLKAKPLKEVYSDKYSYELQKSRTQMVHQQTGNSRSIASHGNEKENSHEPNVMNSFWLVTMLSALGALSAWWGRKKTR